MSRVLAAGLCLFIVAACAAAKHPSTPSPEDVYGGKIKDWQERIRREGWSEDNVRRLLADCRGMVRYQMELKDRWSTPREFIDDGFAGDCEDIAFFLMSGLKRLGYPHQVRVLVVKDLFNYHALLKVELPEGRWVIFETMPGGRLEVQTGRLHPVVEFDDVHVAYF
jgi:hypothetical protein